MIREEIHFDTSSFPMAEKQCAVKPLSYTLSKAAEGLGFSEIPEVSPAFPNLCPLTPSQMFLPSLGESRMRNDPLFSENPGSHFPFSPHFRRTKLPYLQGLCNTRFCSCQNLKFPWLREIPVYFPLIWHTIWCPRRSDALLIYLKLKA